MNFLHSKSLRQVALYGLVVMFFVFAGEYLLIRYKFHGLDEAEQKLDFTRRVQLSNQQIQLLVQRFKTSDSTLAAEIEVRLTQQDHELEILGGGGRIDRTDVILKPLSRLPRISYDNLVGYWSDYKESVQSLWRVEIDTAAVATVQPSAADSLAGSAPVTTPANVRKNQLSSIKSRQESLGVTLSRWFDNLFYDLEKEVSQKKSAVDYWLLGLILFDGLLLAFVVYAFNRYVVLPLDYLRDQTADRKQVTGLPQNEIGQVATRINDVLENLKDATEFVGEIGKGNLTISYHESLDNGYKKGKNMLADSLIEMQGKLRTMNEEERKRQWANEGLAKFVDILRSSNDNLSTLGDKITSALVQYTRSSQGGLYIFNDEDENNKYLELISLFAFDIKKFESRKIKLGEGLLGQTFLEKETTYYKNVPDEYIRITSGLGEANPRSILIVPLKVDREVYGIVELASFQEFLPHEIAFVEKLGETIASTLSNVRAAQRNRHLIEQFQQQTEEMRAQEEEMRQNMEELQATQEEIARKEKSYINRIKELEEEAKHKISNADLEASKATLARAEQHYRERIKELENQLAKTPSKGDDWETAEELSHSLKINLEALKITQEELERKSR